MKIKDLLIILLAAGLLIVSFKWATSTSGQPLDDKDATTESAATGKSAGSGQFTEFNVTEEWDENPFTFFKGSGLLLAVGDKESNNAMTIGWGSLGNIWRSLGNSTVTVYVAEGRYTYQFMEKYKYFTIMAFDEQHKDILEYMGTHSGRDGDKAKHLGLHTLYTENGTPYYEEASMVLECEIIYKDAFRPECMNDSVKKFYEGFDAGVHHIYIGNIVKALKK